MENLNLLLHIIFGGATAWIGAKFSHGKELGVWSFIIGAIAGLIGGLLFLTVFNPGDTIGSVIASMFVSLLAIFLLRLAESNSLAMPSMTARANPNSPADPVAASDEESPSDSGFFNFFGEEEESAPSTPQAPQAPTIVQPSENAPIGYDSEMFGIGVNSLVGQSLFDTDDEVPNVPNEIDTYTQYGEQAGYADELFAPPGNNENRLSTETDQSAHIDEELDAPHHNDIPSQPAETEQQSALPTEEPYAFIEDEHTLYDKTQFTEINFNEQGVSELGTVEDIYGANYTYDASPGISMPQKPEISEVTAKADKLETVGSTEQPKSEPLLDFSTEPPVIEKGQGEEESKAQTTVQAAEMPPIPTDNQSADSSYERSPSERHPSELDASPAISQQVGTGHDTAKLEQRVDSEAREYNNAGAQAEATANSASKGVADSQQINSGQGNQNHERQAVAVEVAEETMPDGMIAGQNTAPIVQNEYPDDLTKIKGVGKVYAHRLHQMGIFTWSQVADTEPPLLKDWVAATKTANVREWPQLARSLAVAFNRVDASYSGPIPDELTAIVGITKKIELMLYRCGIMTYEQLADADSADLKQCLSASNITDAAIQDWIGQAKKKL